MIVTKLKSLEFDSHTALAWFLSFLKSRELIVEIKQNINGIMSTERSALLIVKIEVPQGSVLGPIFYLCCLLVSLSSSNPR